MTDYVFNGLIKSQATEAKNKSSISFCYRHIASVDV